jgi:hypothetical protein
MVNVTIYSSTMDPMGYSKVSATSSTFFLFPQVASGWSRERISESISAITEATDDVWKLLDRLFYLFGTLIVDMCV